MHIFFSPSYVQEEKRKELHNLLDCPFIRDIGINIDNYMNAKK